MNERIKAVRKKAGLSVRKLAAEIGMPSSTYAAYEDPAKFKKPIIPLDLAKKIAAVVEPLGVDRSEVFQLAGVTGELQVPTADRSGDDGGWVTVTGAVAAGVWRQETDWPAGEQYDVNFGASPYPRSKRFAVRMEGLSMNRTIQPGADLECLWVKFSSVPPMPGDLVIVERQNHDMMELTCKRLAVIGDQYALVCESHEPEFQEPIFIGKADNGSFVDDEIRIIGIVLSAKLDLAPRGLSQRRYR